VIGDVSKAHRSYDVRYPMFGRSFTLLIAMFND
jgi:hypothetical protein